MAILIIIAIAAFLIYLVVKPKKGKAEKRAKLEQEYQKIEDEKKIKEMEKALKKKRIDKIGERLGYTIMLIMLSLAFIGGYGNYQDEQERKNMLAKMTPAERKAYEETRAKEKASHAAMQEVNDRERRLKSASDDSMREFFRYGKLVRRIQSEGFRIPRNYLAQIAIETSELKAGIAQGAKLSLQCDEIKNAKEKTECKITNWRYHESIYSRFTNRWNKYLDDL